MTLRGPEPTPRDDVAEPSGDGGPFAATAFGPADVRDTPHVKPSFAVVEESAPPASDPWVGRVLSNVYEVERRIGEGGMGAVYVARHVHLDKRFAIKVLTDNAVQRSNAVERLRQEAMAAAKIDHENIVQVVNFDRASDGSVFIVMELLHGESLAAVLGRGPLELHRALPIAHAIARALHAAHEHGIVHRDLKPENVFLADKGGRTVVKVLDFGISKIKSADAEQVRMTRTGQLIGTPLYMSPEQARGEQDVDRRVDVYALGVIVYEMIAGAPPFEGRNYFELLWKHGNEPPPSIKERNPNVYVPDTVEAIVQRALAKTPEERFESMAAFEAALAAAAPETVDAPVVVPSPSPIDPVPPTRVSARSRSLVLPTRSLRPVLAIGAVALLAIGATVWFAGRDPEPRPVARRVSPSAAPIAAERPSEPPPVEPPDARELVFPLDSLPSGAEVRGADGTVLGVTPFRAQLPASDVPVTLRFRRAGYLEESITFVPSEDAVQPVVRLRRRRAPAEPGLPLPIKTGL